MKESFLKLVDAIENIENLPEEIILKLFNLIRVKVRESKVDIIPIKDPERLNINDVVNLLEKHFSYNYKIHGDSKLPVIAFYAIFQNIINEIVRYKNCYLRELSNHTASDLTSKTAGDIEVYNSKQKLIEAIEIKHNKQIDITTIRIAIDKIYKYNPARYCIFSFNSIKQEDLEDINHAIKEVELNHGCQIIVNGILPTIKYYLRLISSVPNFIENYRILVETDKELQKIHKDKLLELFLIFQQPQ